MNRSLLLVVMIGVGAIALAAPARAQLADPPEMDWNVIAGGGQTDAAADDLTLGGTAGQAAVAVLSAGDLTLSGGFWPVVSRPNCPADMTGDGQISVQDFLSYLQLYAAADARADMTGDGAVSVMDFLTYLSLYAAGCP
jgi:hypothetical protein